MEGWDAVAEQEYVVRLDNAGGFNNISDCSEKRVVAFAEVEFHFSVTTMQLTRRSWRIEG